MTTMVTRVVNGVVAEEPFALIGDFTIAQSFPAALAAQMVEVSSGVTVHEGYLYTSGAFSAPPAPPAPTAAQAAQAAYDAAIAAGVAITSTGTPALNGTYGLDQLSLNRITAEQTYIATTGKFTNGQATRGWLDQSGTPHMFPSIAEFTAFAEAMAQQDDALIAALDAGLAGGAWVAPAPPASIP